MKFCIILGTRPQIIKCQPIVKELISQKHDLSIIHTGQHYDFQMSQSFFEEMKIKEPNYNLEIDSLSPIKQTSQIITRLEKPLREISPDLVLIPGDTTSAFGATFCAKKIGFKVAHLEAGARSGELEMEEEINRRMIDHCCDQLFAPTMNCYHNLQKENVIGKSYFTGDTMLDVFLEYSKRLNLRHSGDKDLVLMTIHRRENISDYSKIKNILQLATKIAKSGKNLIFPMHPHTKKQIQNFGISLENLNTVEPLKYSEILRVLSKSALVITDSGGLQKEAYWMKIPCITLRKSSEWKETFENGNNILLPSIGKTTYKKIINIIENPSKLKPPRLNLFGNGKAARKILSLVRL